VPISAFDPVFSPADLSLLASLGVKTMSENQHGRCALEGPTLVFMPHCDLELYENLFRANWNKGQLAQMLLIGNDLRRYTESTPARILDLKSPCVNRLAPIGTCEPLPEHNAFPNALSSTSVFYVQSGVSMSQSDAFWELPSVNATVEVVE